MKKLLSIVLILGFLFVDMLFFHDLFKPGESTSLPQYLIGFLSIPVMLISAQYVLKNSHTLRRSFLYKYLAKKYIG